MALINLTPHDITIVGNVQTVVIPRSGQIARVSVTRVKDGDYLPVDDARGDYVAVPVYQVQMGPVEGLPDPVEGREYLVSALVAAHPDVRGRPDVFSPGELVRDEAGRVVGCRGLTAA